MNRCTGNVGLRISMLDFESFDDNFPSDARVEEIVEEELSTAPKYDDISSLSSVGSEAAPKNSVGGKKTARPKAARKFVDIINEEAVMRENDIIDQIVSHTATIPPKLAKLTHVGLPKPVTTDIRQYYPRMFMNSINSGDLLNVQNYFNTFMTGPCKFIARHQVSTTYGIPTQMTAVGPQFFSHYLMCCFVTFPDMVLKLVDSRVITGTDWVGTKIVMDTEVHCTKIYDLVDYPWVPEVDSLSELYGKMSVRGSSSQKDQSKSSGGDTETKNSNKSKGRKRAPASGSTATTTTSSSRSSKNPSASGNTTATTSSSGSSSSNVALTRIPQTYVERLISESTLLHQPQPLLTKGTITLYLDEHNCMQHVVVDLAQQNKLPRR